MSRNVVLTGEIGLISRPPANTGVVINKAVTMSMVRGWMERQQIVYAVPDMDKVLCVFTRKPIGEKNAFAFIRRLQGDTRIVLCLASCKLDSSQYEVVSTQNNMFTVFKLAIQNIQNMQSVQNMKEVTDSLFSAPLPETEAVRPPKRKQRRPATNRRSSRKFVLAQG